MKKLILTAGLFFLFPPLFGDDIANFAIDPEHGHLNNDGAVDVSFDLPQLASVEKIFLEITIDGVKMTVPGTETEGKKLSSTGNTIALAGRDIYELAGGATAYLLFSDDDSLLSDDTPVDEKADDDLVPADGDDDGASIDGDTEMPDEDAAYSEEEWPAERDRLYAMSLVVVVDRDAIVNDADVDADADADTDVNDDDFVTTRRAPIIVGSESRESFSVKLDNVPPAAPAAIAVEGGNRKLIVTMTHPERDARGVTGEQVGRYHFTLSGIFLKDGAETEATLEYDRTVSESERKAETVSFTLEGSGGHQLINADADPDRYRYTLRGWAEDLAGNADTGRFIETTGRAVTTEGFWSHYKSAGGTEKGGYCFIATAGYGSYGHPYVRVLRDWRDSFLATHAAGRAFIAFYYRNGPAWGALIERGPLLRPFVRAALFPLVLFAYLFLSPWGLLLLCAPLFLWFTHRRSSLVTALALFLLIFSFPLAAEKKPQAGQAEKKEEKKEEKTKLHGDFSFNSSFYYPADIDRSATGSPFTSLVKDKLNYMPALYAGLDIPAGEYLKLTPRIGIGFAEVAGRTVRLDGTAGTEKSYLYVIPLTGEIKLRPVYEFPVRPYIAAGLDYYFWWIIEDKKLAMDGGKFGFHGSVGVQISLNFIDPKTAIKLRESTGILDTALFAHYRLERVDNFFDKKSFDLSSSRFEFGIIFDY